MCVCTYELNTLPQTQQLNTFIVNTAGCFHRHGYIAVLCLSLSLSCPSITLIMFNKEYTCTRTRSYFSIFCHIFWLLCCSFPLLISDQLMIYSIYRKTKQLFSQQYDAWFRIMNSDDNQFSAFMETHSSHLILRNFRNEIPIKHRQIKRWKIRQIENQKQLSFDFR